MPFTSVALSVRSVLSGILTPVDPIYVADYSTLRGITTGSLLAFITGKFADGTTNTSIAGWFQADPNDQTSIDDNNLTLVATNGMRWKRILATGLQSGAVQEYPVFPANTPLPWTIVGANSIEDIHIGGLIFPKSLFTIAGNLITHTLLNLENADVLVRYR